MEDPDSLSARELAALRAEVAELHRRLEFAQGAVDALPFSMFWKDRDSVYVGANREQGVRAGLARGEAIAGLSDGDLPWTSEQVAAFRADDQRVVATGEPHLVIVETQRIADRGDRLCETHKAPLRDATGQVIGVVGWYEDVTEREAQRNLQKLLDEGLRRAHKQDSLGTLAGGIAHDFNNILASIMANLWLVQESLPADHVAADSLADIQRAGVRAKRLVEQLTSIKQKQPEQLGPVSLDAVVLEASSLLRAMIPPGVELTTDLDPTVPPVLADAAQIHQIVTNLATNAWLAIKDRASTAPRIEVSVAPCELDAEMAARLNKDLAPGVFVTLTVRDNGIGMDAATQRRIFEPFFTTREVGSGTGLGLSVVHGIVAAHGGAIDVESALGRGTTVRVYLPTASGQTAVRSIRPPGRLSSGPPSAEKHVLYVDDDPALLRVVTRLLRLHHCRVTTFTDPRDAAAAMRERPAEYDLLVVDFSMPHLSGLDLAAIAAERSPALPVILMSGYVTADLRRDAVRAGVARILHKVDIATELVGAVHSVLSSHKTG